MICAYLEKKFPKPALYPSDPYDYARALWFEEFMDGGVVPARGPEGLLRAGAEAAVLGRQGADAADEETAKKILRRTRRRCFAYLEKELGDHEFFVGDRLTIADIAVASILVNPRHAGFAPERKRLPKLRAFLDRMCRARRSRS